MLKKFLAVSTLSFALMSAAQACPRQTVQGVFKKTVCTQSSMTVGGSNQESPEECRPVIKLPPANNMRVCQTTTTKAFGQDVITEQHCSNEPPLKDPKGLMKNLQHGTFVTLTLSCMTIEAVSPRGTNSN